VPWATLKGMATAKKPPITPEQQRAFDAKVAKGVFDFVGAAILGGVVPNAKRNPNTIAAMILEEPVVQGMIASSIGRVQGEAGDVLRAAIDGGVAKFLDENPQSKLGQVIREPVILGTLASVARRVTALREQEAAARGEPVAVKPEAKP